MVDPGLRGGDGRKAILLLFAAAVLVAGGCGTRVPHQEALQIAEGGQRVAAGSGDQPLGGSNSTQSSIAGAASSGPTLAGGVTSPVTSGVSSRAGVSGAGLGSAGGGKGTLPTGSAGGQSTSGGGASGSRAPIVVAMEGDFSGIAGADTAPSRDAYEAWVAMVNSEGGINGHPIKLYTYDDGGDASQAMSAIENFVQNQHVIALVNAYPPGNDAAVAQYVQKKNIPIVGGWATDPVWNQTPMMFPAVPSSAAGAYAWAKAMANAGDKKVGAVYCIEGAVCKTREQLWASYASQLGMQVVFQSGISLAQPDYTSDCLDARSNGAQAMLPEADGATVIRFANSCSAQGYTPLLIDPAPLDTVTPSLAGTIATLPSFPWFITSGSPALTAYGAAMKRYFPNEVLSSGSSQGWVDGVLLGAALANIGSGTPTTQDVLSGLWAIHNNTLGGLTPPLTFKQGQPAPDADCSFEAQVKGGQWTAPVGMQPLLCKP